MSHHCRMELSDSERDALEQIRDHHPLPYVRERAAAILKMASGLTAKFVAEFGLLKPHDPDTLGGWRHRFLEEGVAGLKVKPGRGRKPAFSPSVPRRGRR